MKKIVFSLVLVLFSINLWAQKDVPFEKEYFKDNKKEFKEAVRIYEEGDEYFTGQYGVPDYQKAIERYEKAYEFNPNSAQLNYKLGIAYLNSLHKYHSLEMLKKAYSLNTNVSPDIHMYLGMAYHIQYKFKKAIQEYEMYFETIKNSDNEKAKREVRKKIEECKTGQELYNNPIRVWIDNLGFEINSKHPEYAPLIATDESSIFFTSRRPDTQGGDKAIEDNQYFEDIYRAEWKDGSWTKAENMGEIINSKSHDATAGLSPDGNTLFVYDGAKNGGDIFVSKYKDGKWSKLKDVGKNVNDKKSHETSACLSYDGKELFFVSNKEGGLGEHDIYKSVWDEEKERWGEAVNLGEMVNTEYDEAGAFIHPDGKTLYFASKGHKTMGGFDIFYSVFEDGKWSEPINIGYPVNTPDDDVHFVVSANGRTGYFASFHEEGLGEKDLYKVTFLGSEKLPLLTNEDNLIASVVAPIAEKVNIPKVEVNQSDLAILKGIVRDEKTKKPLASNIQIIDNETNEIISELTTDVTDGKYLVSLPSGKNYAMVVRATDYLFHSENFLIPEASGYREYNKNIELKRVEVGKEIVLRNIFFDLNKATLRSESKAELERLIKLMNENPTMKIEISGHTDSRGDAAYNQKLSERRAESVVNYLIDHGIPKSRMEFAGYGETKLIMSDSEIYKLPVSKREEAHQQNRRTVFKVLSV